MSSLFEDLQLGLQEAIDYEKGIISAKVANCKTDSEPFYSKSNMAHLRRGLKDLDAGKGQKHELIEVN